MRKCTTRYPRAFTLIEVLVVLFLIALIVGILLVAMGGVRSSTRRVESANALRQMVAGYDSYSTDHNKQLMPGFVTAVQALNLDIIPKRQDGSPHNDIDSQGYVWRLAPYLGNSWETMFIDYGSARLNARLSEEYEAGIYGLGTLADPDTQYGIARVPSFGLNSIFLGGDSVHGGAPANPFHPWNALGNDTIAATKFAQVKVPAKMIVFAPVEQANLALNPSMEVTDVRYGYVEVRAPFLTLLADDTWTDKQWDLAGDGSQIIDTGDVAAGCGLLTARWGTAAFPVGNLDGSVTNETYTSLSNDMTRWSHKAKGHFVE